MPSYSQTEVWTTVHAGMAIVCACLPIFKPLVIRMSKSTWISKIGESLARQWSVNWSRTSGFRGARNTDLNIITESEINLRDDLVPQPNTRYTGMIETLALREEIV